MTSGHDVKNEINKVAKKKQNPNILALSNRLRFSGGEGGLGLDEGGQHGARAF